MNSSKQSLEKEVFQTGRLANVPISVKKLTPILELIRGDEVYVALQKLQLMPKKGAYYTAKLLKSVIADVENNKKMSAKGMKVLELFATRATYLKRYRFGAKGSIKPYRKYRANIFIKIGYGS